MTTLWKLTASGWQAPGRTTRPAMPDSTRTRLSLAALPVYPDTGGPFGDLTATGGGKVLDLVTPGAVVSGYKFPCRLRTRAAGITIRDALVAGDGLMSTATGLIDCSAEAGRGASIQRVWLQPDTLSEKLNGVFGHGFTIRDSYIADVIDGFQVQRPANPNSPADVLLERVCVESFAYIADSVQPDGHTHNDGVQWFNGSNLTIRQCVFRGKMSPRSTLTSAYAPNVTGQGITVTPQNGTLGNLLIEDTFYEGFSRHVIMSQGNLPNGSAIGTIRRTLFKGDSHNGTAGPDVQVENTLTLATSGLTRYDNATPAVVSFVPVGTG